MKCRTSSRRPPRRPRRRGLTLVEVVAGLALLSALLVAVLTTKARVTRQAAEAQRRLDAVAAADRLLTHWWRDVRTLPREGAGAVSGDGGLSWRTRTVPNNTVNALSASVIRLEVIDAGSGPGRGSVMASVEVVLDDAAPDSDAPPRYELARARLGGEP